MKWSTSLIAFLPRVCLVPKCWASCGRRQSTLWCSVPHLSLCTRCVFLSWMLCQVLLRSLRANEASSSWLLAYWDGWKVPGEMAYSQSWRKVVLPPSLLFFLDSQVERFRLSEPLEARAEVPMFVFATAPFLEQSEGIEHCHVDKMMKYLLVEHLLLVTDRWVVGRILVVFVHTTYCVNIIKKQLWLLQCLVALVDNLFYCCTAHAARKRDTLLVLPPKDQALPTLECIHFSFFQLSLFFQERYFLSSRSHCAIHVCFFWWSKRSPAPVNCRDGPQSSSTHDQGVMTRAKNNFRPHARELVTVYCSFYRAEDYVW